MAEIICPRVIVYKESSSAALRTCPHLVLIRNSLTPPQDLLFPREPFRYYPTSKGFLAREPDFFPSYT